MRELSEEAKHQQDKLVACIESHKSSEFSQCLSGNGESDQKTLDGESGQKNIGTRTGGTRTAGTRTMRIPHRQLENGMVMTTTIPDTEIVTPMDHKSDSTSFMDPCANLPIDPAERAAAGWTTLPSNDDKSTSLKLPFDFSLYGSLYAKLESLIYINNNGNLSFEKSYEDYTASGFPIDGIAMIAPFWSDVDTRGAGNGQLWYKIIGENTFSVIWDRVGEFVFHE